MGTLHGLDTIAKRLYPDAPVITGYTGVEPRFVGKKPRKLTAGSDTHLATNNALEVGG
jgi:hypothetical protein